MVTLYIIDLYTFVTVDDWIKDLLVDAGFQVLIVGLLEISVGVVADDLDLAILVLAAHRAEGQRLAEGGSGVKHHPDGGGGIIIW